MEEVLSAIAEPFVANLTYKDGETMPTKEDLIAQGLTGVLVSGILKGAVSGSGIVVDAINQNGSAAPISSIDFLKMLQSQLLQTRQTAPEEKITKIDKAASSLNKVIAFQTVTESANPAQAIQSYISDGTLTRSQGHSLWHLVSAAAVRKDDGLPTSAEGTEQGGHGLLSAEEDRGRFCVMQKHGTIPCVF